MEKWLFHVCLLIPVIFSSQDWSEQCVPELLVGEDALFCSEDLQVIYPGIGNVSCRHIPDCNGYVQDLVKSWKMPNIIFTKAKLGELYSVIIADPDAPSRRNPVRKSWRHLLVIDVPGADLLTGKNSGKILSEYTAPSPPEGTGYHRYQIFIYKQNPGTTLDLLPEEKKSLGNWDPNVFAARYQLGSPVATTQFMAQNPEDEM